MRNSEKTWLWPALLGIFAGGIALVAPRTAQAVDGDAIAIVNGHPLSRETLVNQLIDAHGLQMLQQMIVLELARQETRRRGISVTPEEIQQQYQRAVDEIVPERDAAGITLDAAGKQEALNTVLQQRCVTMPEFMLAMERNAHLRKLIEVDLRIDEATLREEFARRHGEKVEVRHIQLAAGDTRPLHEALDLLGRATEFGAVAQRLSANAQTGPRGGLMEPFTFADERVPSELREVAFSLAPGEVSAPTLAGKYIHILKLERRIPPEDVTFEEVREQVEQQLRQRVVRQKMDELVVKLFNQANIRVLEPKLKEGFEKLRAQSAQTAVP